MKVIEINEKDIELINEAKKIISNLYDKDKHHIGCAIRTKTGEIITAVNMEAYVRKVSICAEAVAIGKAVSDGEKGFETIVAVRQSAPGEFGDYIKVVTPCGMCRELISDYCPGADVIVPYENNIVKCNIKELLPLKYTRE
ncbi:MAG: cytidine deaminase [Clostridiaceae bacterium]